MPLPPELLGLMNDTIVLEPRLGVDKYNDFTFGPPVSVKAYVARNFRRFLTMEGREVTSNVQVILADPTVVVKSDDRLTLADGDQPSIIQILSAPDENGDPYYLELRGG